MAQKFSLYGDISVAQNLSFFAGVYGLGRARARERIEAMLTRPRAIVRSDGFNGPDRRRRDGKAVVKRRESDRSS